MTTNDATMNPISDDELMRLTTHGDREAFRVLVRRHQGLVTRAACRLLNGDRATAEDVGQEAFLRLYRAATTYAPSGGLRAFLLTITRNLCRDHLRRLRPTEPIEDAPEGEDPSPGGDCRLLAAERAEAVRLALAMLSEDHRAVLILSHYERLSNVEIAVIVGCPVGTVASRKHLAHAALRGKLQAYLEDE